MLPSLLAHTPSGETLQVINLKVRLPGGGLFVLDSNSYHSESLDLNVVVSCNAAFLNETKWGRLMHQINRSRVVLIKAKEG